MNTTIQVRVDKKIKQKADKTFKDLGLDISSGVKIFLHQVIASKSIPFEIRTMNGFTPAQEKAILKETEYLQKHGKRYDSAEELFGDILKHA